MASDVSPKLTFATRAAATGRLIPAIAAGIAVSIILSGFLPLRWFWFQDYVIARHILQWDSPFMPDVRYHSRFYRGDEAAAGNLKSTEALGWRTFSTDRFGFRHTPPVAPGRPVEAVVFRGFSYTFGGTLSDEKTFPAALSRHLGVNTYNAARFHEDPETPEDFDRLMSRVGVRPKTVVYVHLEPNEFYLSPTTTQPDVARRRLRFAMEFPLNWVRMSPVIVSAVEAKKAIQNDVILHNRYRDHIASFPLPGGARMLARKGDVERVQTDFPDSVVAGRDDYIAWWNQRMIERGANMIVLLVPEKMTVYGPALGLKIPADPLLNRMERDLSARGLRVVNGLNVLRPTASQDLATGNLAYLREDHHWTAECVERLAKATAEAIGSTHVTESSRIR